MLSNYFRRIALKVNADKTNIHFSVPFISILEPVNDLVDLMTLIGFFLPFGKFKTDSGKSYSYKEAIKLVRLGELALSELMYLEPFDLVDVETKDAVVKIGIK